jgi:hypothetical protein
MPFSDDVSYVFDRQLEEAGLLIVNKRDLLKPDEYERLARLVSTEYPKTRRLFLSGKEEAGCDAWLAELERNDHSSAGIPLREIDYEKYAAGELRLAWLDASIRADLPETSALALRNLFSAIVAAVREKGAGIGHIKAVAEALENEAPRASWKAGAVAVADEKEAEAIPPLWGPVRLTLNARVEMSAENLDALVARTASDIMDPTAGIWKWERKESFHPGIPRPQRGRVLP